jgi:hypothetical protein
MDGMFQLPLGVSAVLARMVNATRRQAGRKSKSAARRRRENAAVERREAQRPSPRARRTRKGGSRTRKGRHWWRRPALPHPSHFAWGKCPKPGRKDAARHRGRSPLILIIAQGDTA